MTRKMIYLMLNSQHAHDASFISFNKKQQQQIMQPCMYITNVRIVICVKNVLPRGNWLLLKSQCVLSSHHITGRVLDTWLHVKVIVLTSL